MDLKKIKDLIEIMKESKTKRLRLKEKDFEIELEAESEQMPSFVEVPFAISGRSEQKIESVPHKELSHPPSSEDLEPEKKEGTYITSPMVGTFYATPSPEEPPFVKVGDTVHENSVVCIVEAMKVMNEVKAGKSGKVAELLVENGHPVEFGTKLFRLE